MDDHRTSPTHPFSNVFYLTSIDVILGNTAARVISFVVPSAVGFRL